MIEGTIKRGMGGLYTAVDKDGNEFVLRAKKKFRRMKLTPLVGDQILFTKGEISDEHGWVEEILPRKSVCLRPPVANVSMVAIVLAAEPEPDYLLIDKLLIYAQKQAIKAALIVNKEDLGEATADTVKRQYEKADVLIIPVSALTKEGMGALYGALKGETVCFAGQSGVGKSSLLNALLGLNAETGDISARIARGKNTTRHAELFESEGFRILDTPGFSLLELTELEDPVTLQKEYPEFAPYIGQCRFQPCCHMTEPGCAVTRAAQSGEIPMERLARYHKLFEIQKETWRNRYD